MQKRRVVYFDLLNIVACLAVVFLHCNTMVHTYDPGRNWVAALAIEVLFFWAVPIFVMLSGANLMRYRDRYDTKTFFKKRLVRTFVPFLIWSVALYVVRFGMRNPSPTFGLGEFYRLFMTNGIESIYWFFFPLFALYLAMPVLSLLADKKRALAYLAVSAFVLQSVIPPLAQMVHIPWNASIAQPLVTTFVFYAVVGYLLATTEVPKHARYVLYALGIAALMLRFAFTLVSSHAIGDVDRTLFDYSYFTAALPAMALFVWFKYHNWSFLEKRPSATKVVARISGCSFGVYLMHFALLRGVVFGFMAVPTTSVLLRTLGPFVLYAACVLIVLAIKKIPVLKYIVP